jgi:hypothetical protein
LAWELGFVQAASELLWQEQGAVVSTTMPMNNSRTACCLLGLIVSALLRLPLADRCVEKKRMKGEVASRAGGGGTASAVAHGRDTERWLCSSSSYSSPAGRGGKGS